MALHWTKEDTPRWDAAKQALFGPEELAAVGMTAPEPGEPIADEWWHVTDDDGAVAGYGWLDSEWGDAEITFLVGRDRRGAGIGGFIVDRLEDEAAGRGLNYIYNVVPASHPDPAVDDALARGARLRARPRRPAAPGPARAHGRILTSPDDRAARPAT